MLRFEKSPLEVFLNEHAHQKREKMPPILVELVLKKDFNLSEGVPEQKQSQIRELEVFLHTLAFSSYIFTVTRNDHFPCSR